MIFSSITFLFVFLPAVLFFYYISADEFRNYVLLFFSFVFYAWGEPKAFFIMLAVIVINYIFALCIQNSKRLQIFFLIADLIICFGVLFYFKYFDFSIRLLNRILDRNIPLFNIALPIGISFYIFQSVSYSVDVFRKECTAQKNIAALALYISFFPQLIAGPVIKYHDIEGQIKNRKITLNDFSEGIKRFILGLSKKVLIANTAAAVADSVFGNLYYATSPSLWLGAAAYSIQIYFDFSGYSDMALGLGRMFGFKFPENFNYPYISVSVTEFWRRWHISLSSWFREYVYIPLGGNRVSKIRNIFNIFIVFLLTGIWHGAALTFVAWGLYHGFFNIMEKLFGISKASKKISLRILQHLYLMLTVIIGWIIFRSPGLNFAKDYILRMLGIKSGMSLYETGYFISGYGCFILVFGCVLSLPVFPLVKEKATLFCLKREVLAVVFSAVQNVLYLGMLLLCTMSLAAGTYNPFIYFRF